MTVKEYRSALGILTPKQKELLKKLYRHAPFTDSNEIAAVLNFKGFGAANLHIGTIGKSMANHIDLHLTESYSHPTGEKPAYYTLVHRFTDKGWDLQKNLREAIKTDLVEISEDFFRHSTEISSKDNYFFSDGKAVYILVNKYERDRKARQECLRLKGSICTGCGFDFKKEYGNDIPDDLMHVHHVTALHEVRKEQEKNVVDDLIPLCPNCHAVIHSKSPMMSIEELKERRKNGLQQ